jgi:hypothetical protein
VRNIAQGGVVQVGAAQVGVVQIGTAQWWKIGLAVACGKPKALPASLTLDKPCPPEPSPDAQPK